MSPVKRLRDPSSPQSAPAAKSGAPGPSKAADAACTETADRLHSAAIHLLRRVRVRDRESGIGPAQLSALSVLVFGGPKSLGELADAEQVRPPTMSRIVAGLERSRLVRRQNTEDARRVRLEPTPKGVALMWEGRKRRVETLARAVAALQEAERGELRRALALIQQIIREI
jgi:DNA-binding MarR family transcriptional regulator